MSSSTDWFSKIMARYDFRNYDFEENMETAGVDFWLCREKETGELVTMKKVRRLGLRNTYASLREELIHNILNHENILNVKVIVPSGMQHDMNKPPFFHKFLIFEHIDTALADLIKNTSDRLSEEEIKKYMTQLLNGLAHCHRFEVIHRNISTSSLLVDKHGILKIAGFRSYKELRGRQKLLETSSNLHYIAPEVLLGCETDNSSIDMWAVGCIIAELLIGRPLFDGSGDLEQLDLIFRAIGSPTARSWPDWLKFPLAHMVGLNQYPGDLAKQLGGISPSALDLIQKLLCFCPGVRIKAADTLEHQWLRT